MSEEKSVACIQLIKRQIEKIKSFLLLCFLYMLIAVVSVWITWATMVMQMIINITYSAVNTRLEWTRLVLWGYLTIYSCSLHSKGSSLNSFSTFWPHISCSGSNLCAARMWKSSLYWNACYVGLLYSDYQLTADQNDVWITQGHSNSNPWAVYSPIAHQVITPNPILKIDGFAASPSRLVLWCLI